MAGLILRYDIKDEQIELTPRLLAKGQETPWPSHPRRSPFNEVVKLSERMHDVLVQAVGGMCDPQGNLDQQGAQGFLGELRKLGLELQECLLPKEVTDALKSQWWIQEIVFECAPRLSTVPFDLMVLWDDYLGYRFGTGRRLLTPTLPAPAENPPPQADVSRGELPCQAFSLVDPGGLLEKSGAMQIRKQFRHFLDSWEQLTLGRPARTMIDFEKVRAFQPFQARDLKEALRHHRFVNLVCHHVYNQADPDKSGFVLGTTGQGASAVFTAADLKDAFNAATLRPWILLAMACRSGATEGWEPGWLDTGRPYGMVDAALQVGIAHYVGTIVNIPADLCVRFIPPFYQALVQGRTVGQSVLTARRWLRKNVGNPLDPGTALGLAFVLYGDPTRGYFCTEGHLVATAPQVTCEAVEGNEAWCGRVVCSQDASYGQFRCRRHGRSELRCSAGHRVQDGAQLVRCESCSNLVCPDCPGYAQGLCWEHCCHQGHRIQPEACSKRCPDPAGKHPEEKRSVCPNDDGWMRGRCNECLATSVSEFEACPHCGHRINDDCNSAYSNPWSEVLCGCCRRPYCRNCESWYLATLYCRDSGQGSSQARDSAWLDALAGRGEDDVELATLRRLEARLAMSTQFQQGLATNVVEQTRRCSFLPIVRSTFKDVVMPWPRWCLRGVTKDVADLTQELGGAIQAGWQLPVIPGSNQPWRPPAAWLDLYSKLNQLKIHLIRGLVGRPVVVAVATLTPVEFQQKRGPVLIPGSAVQLERVKQAVTQWRKSQKGWTQIFPDTYLVVLSTTGWTEDVCGQYEPGYVTLVASPQGGLFRMNGPCLAGMPQNVKEFVRRLSPQTVYQRKEAIREWIVSSLEAQDYVSPGRVQEALEAKGHAGVRDEEVVEAFDELAATGRFKKVEGPDGSLIGLGKASRQERNRQMLRRRWRSAVIWGAGLSSAVGSIVSFLLNHPKAGWGGVVVAIMLPLLNCFLQRLAAMRKQP